MPEVMIQNIERNAHAPYHQTGKWYTYGSNGEADFFPVTDMVNGIGGEGHDQDCKDDLGETKRETP